MIGRAALLTVGLLAGCASTAGPEQEGELQRAIRECRERDGVLIPFRGGAATGRVETDFACQINSPAGRTGDRNRER